MYKTSQVDRPYYTKFCWWIIYYGWVRYGLDKTHIINEPVKGTRLQHRHEGLVVLQSPLDVDGVGAVQPVPCKTDETFHCWLRLHSCHNELFESDLETASRGDPSQKSDRYSPNKNHTPSPIDTHKHTGAVSVPTITTS